MIKKLLLNYCFIIGIFSCLIPVNFLKAQTFDRIETFAGLGVLKANNGVAVADYDGDNDLDLFVVAKEKDVDGVASSHSRLFRNNNDGTFTDVTDSSGLVNLFPSTEQTNVFGGLSGFKNGAFWGDYDNDGFPDLFLTNTSKIQLFHNEKNGTFVEVTTTAGFQKNNDCLNTGATWFDYNKDGYLDIYLTIWSSNADSCGNRLYKNNKNGTFTDVSNLFQGVVNKLSYMSIPFDFNNDGWMDLYVANDAFTQKNDLFINNQGTGFTEQSAFYGLDHSTDDMGMAVGDYNNDGFFDIYISAIQTNALYKSVGGKFINVAKDLGVEKTGWSWDVNFSDFDLDGDEDLFVVNGFRDVDRNRYFKNIQENGVYKFIDSSIDSKLNDVTISAGAGVFDYDNDGDLDILVTNNDRASYFYENKTTDFTQPDTNLHWLKVKLEGTTSNRDAVGTKVSVTTNKGTLVRYNSGVSFLSQNLKPVHFGFGSASEILELRITWPSGLIEKFQNIPLDKTILVKEGIGVEVLNLEPSKKVYGCTNSTSCNYNPYAIVNSGNCNFFQPEKISGNVRVLKESIETYNYPLSPGHEISWQVSGGIIQGSATESTVTVQWGTDIEGVISCVENNGQCFSKRAELSVTLTSEPVIVSEVKSVARLWNEALLEAIRKDYARPTVHARNLFHTSVALYDAWAVFDKTAETYLLGKNLHGFNSEFNGFVPSETIKESRNKAISYAAYRLLSHRFSNSPNYEHTQENFDSLMEQLGYDTSFTSLDYSDGNGASLGNYIAQTIIDYGYIDGSNEINQYKNLYYQPINEGLDLRNSDNVPATIDPNRWQPLVFNAFIDQSGNLISGTTPSFLSPEWGNVLPFSLTNSDKTTYNRDGHDYNVYHDPGTPPLLPSDDYKWTFSLVAKWSSHLDPYDGVMWDISPKSKGNISVSQFPKQFSDYKNFYKENVGGDIGTGRAINPYTKQPYQPQIVPRGDYTRVLAEFWADGPNSETPPGHWFTILNYVSDHPLFEKRFNGQGDIIPDLEWDVKAYFVLGGTMHDAAISAWGIKGWYDFIRPVSAIRYMCSKGQCNYPAEANYDPSGIPLEEGYVEIVKGGDPLAGANNENVGKIKLFSWKGHDFINNPETDEAGVGWILAEDWWPYQRPTFVTPPFAGYVSGHSTYSRAAAEVMTLLTGDAYFPGGMGEFFAKKNEFLVFEEGPSMDVILQWATYRDASDQCSLSRIWGGIHPPADDIRGRIIGEKIGLEAFDYSLKYFNGQIGANSSDLSNVMIYPNPVSTDLTIEMINDNNNKTIVLYDMNGKMILSKFASESKIAINVESLETGVYLLYISNGKTKTQKLIFKK